MLTAGYTRSNPLGGSQQAALPDRNPLLQTHHAAGARVLVGGLAQHDVGAAPAGLTKRFPFPTDHPPPDPPVERIDRLTTEVADDGHAATSRFRSSGISASTRRPQGSRTGGVAMRLAVADCETNPL